MGQYDVLDDSTVDSSGFGLTERAITFLTEIRKWVNFLAIMGFIMVGIMVLFSIFAGSMMTAMTSQMGGGSVPFGGAFGFIYIIVALIYFFPILYLYKFGSNLKGALARRDNKSLETAFENLKSHYKFIGILAIITLSFYALGLLFMLIAGIAGIGAAM